LKAAALAVGLSLSLAWGSAQLVGCKRSPRPTDPPPPPAALVPDAGLQPNSAVADNELWKSALADPADPIELGRLAEAEGATGLMVGFEEGGAVGLVALAALPFAEDAELATGRLAEVLPRLDPAGLAAVLDCIEGIVQRKRTQTEPLEPLGLRACFDALLLVSQRKETSAEFRARAVSVARLVAEIGPYDAGLLPTEFDRLASRVAPKKNRLQAFPRGGGQVSSLAA
jgi:hypothetical protein